MKITDSMKISDLAVMEENAREVQLLVDLMHYFKLNNKYMNSNEVDSFSIVIEYIGRQDAELT